MIKPIYIVLSLASVSAITLGGIGIANAASASETSTKKVNVGLSGIPRSVFKEERLNAAAQVLNTSVANVQAAHKNKMFTQLITNAGLTKKTFAQKVKAQLTSDLTAKGYTQDQITIALQHRTIARLHHKAKS